MWRFSVSYIIYRGIPVDRLSYFGILEKLNDFISEVARYFSSRSTSLDGIIIENFVNRKKILFLEDLNLIIFQKIKWQGQ